MMVRQGCGVFGHYPQQQGQQELGLGLKHHDSGFEGLGLVGVGEHLQ